LGALNGDICFLKIEKCVINISLSSLEIIVWLQQVNAIKPLKYFDYYFLEIPVNKD
jgi:hypothetical protein